MLIKFLHQPERGRLRTTAGVHDTRTRCSTWLAVHVGIALTARSGSGHAASDSAACATVPLNTMASSAALGQQHPQVTGQQHGVSRAHLYLILHS